MAIVEDISEDEAELVAPSRAQNVSAQNGPAHSHNRAQAEENAQTALTSFQTKARDLQQRKAEEEEQKVELDIVQKQEQEQEQEQEQNDSPVTSTEELVERIGSLTKNLVLPEELMPGFMMSSDKATLRRYHTKVSTIVDKVSAVIGTYVSFWKDVSPEEQLRVMENVLRLYGEEEWSSPRIRKTISDILPHLSSAVPLLILPNLRQYFAPHPSLSSTSRAIYRPSNPTPGLASNSYAASSSKAQEPESMIDLHDSQPFKSPTAWGITNLLLFAVTTLKSEEMEKNIGMIIPPTLVLMDDWEPSYRLKGAKVLDGWMGKLDGSIMSRMGIDKLVLKSLLHTLSLHSNPPLKEVLDITLRLINKSSATPASRTGNGRQGGKGIADNEEKKTEIYADIMDKAIVQGWIYAPSGLEGRDVLIHVAHMMERMCEVMGSGVTRWLKTIIPQLLQPLQYSPTRPVLPHYLANLSCLLCVMRTVRKTCRIGRWRGQILNVLSRLWVMLKEQESLGEIVSVGEQHEDVDGETDMTMTIKAQSFIREIFQELASQVPSVVKDEYNRLEELSPSLFADLIAAATSSKAVRETTPKTDPPVPVTA